MKKTVICLLMAASTINLAAQTTYTTGTVTQPTTTSPLTSSGSNSNNSNSGVNPNGNPGTIISNTATSEGTHNTLIKPVSPAPVPYYNSNSSRLRTNETIISNAVTSDNSITTEKQTSTVPAIANTSTITTDYGSPQFTTWVPEAVVTKLKTKYGKDMYDITTVRNNAGQVAYLVRFKKNGNYSTDIVTAESLGL